MDEMIRYAAVFTAMLSVVQDRYDTINMFEKRQIDMFEKEKKEFLSDKTLKERFMEKKIEEKLIHNKRLREQYMMMRGANYMGNSKWAQKLAAFRNAATTSYETAKIAATPIYTTLKRAVGKGGSKRPIRKNVRVSKRIKQNKRRFKRVNLTLKGGGLFSAITNSTKRTLKAIDSQTGITKVGNRLSLLHLNLKHQKIYFNISHNSKYELLLYLDKMFDTYMVNGFKYDEGDAIAGQELGLSPKLTKFIEIVKEDELKELDDEKKVYTEMQNFYVKTVDGPTRRKNGLDEIYTQAKKISSAMTRMTNGQLRLGETIKAMVREKIKSLRTLAGFVRRNGIVGAVIGVVVLICNVSFYAQAGDPTGFMTAIYLSSQIAEYALIFISSPILDMPPIILRTKEDIMMVAKNLMRVQYIGKNAGKVNEDDNFLNKMMEYYDKMYEIKTGEKYSFSVILKNKESIINPIDKTNYNEFNEKFTKAIIEVTNSLEYLDIYKKDTSSRETLTEQDKTTLSRYYLSEYSADNGISLYNAIGQISLGTGATPFTRYMQYRKIKNKEYILNEITKLQLLLKIYFLKYIQRHDINNIIKLKDTDINNLITFYTNLYNESRTMKSMIQGSPENLEFKYKELHSDIRQEIDKNIRILPNADFIKKYTASQINTSMQARNSENILKYKYKDNCDSRSGMYLLHNQKDADACKLQDKMKKRINQYIYDATQYTKRLEELNKIQKQYIGSFEQINKTLHGKLYMIVMQNYAKRAYVEHEVGVDYLKTKTDVFNTIVKMVSPDDFIKKKIAQNVKDGLTTYMNNRYLDQTYKIQLTLANNSLDNIKTVLTTQISNSVNTLDDLLNANNTTADYDVVGDIEKRILDNPQFKLKTIDVYASINPQKIVAENIDINNQ
jgi:hypothetical protein